MQKAIPDVSNFADVLASPRRLLPTHEAIADTCELGASVVWTQYSFERCILCEHFLLPVHGCEHSWLV